MTQDEMARTALHKIDKHEAVCTERYGSIDNKLNSAVSQVTALSTQIHGRLDGLNKMLGRVIGSVFLMGATAIGTLVFFLLTKGH